MRRALGYRPRMEPPRPGAVARPVALVEGESDAVVVRALLRDRAPGVTVTAMGGVTNLLRFLDALGGPGPHVLALVDHGETRFATGALRRHGVRADSVEELAWHGVFVCERDLEDVLIRGLGPGAVVDALAGMGEGPAFETFTRMPQWRGRPVADQLHRFAGSGSGRKARLAARLVERLDPDALPAPLDALVAAAAACADRT